jgi:hypothetical protein
MTLHGVSPGGIDHADHTPGPEGPAATGAPPPQSSPGSHSTNMPVPARRASFNGSPPPGAGADKFEAFSRRRNSMPTGGFNGMPGLEGQAGQFMLNRANTMVSLLQSVEDLEKNLAAGVKNAATPVQ